MRSGLSVLVAFALSAGCIGSEMGSISPLDGKEGERPVVIALLDSGTNPYLPIFAVEDDARARSAVPVEFTDVTLLLGTKGRDYRDIMLEEDNETWSTLAPGILYHFRGTRVFAISFDHDRDYPYTRDAAQHGSATSYLAARDAPGAVIVMVQISGRTCVQGLEFCPLDAKAIADAMEWVADQPWVDVISLSIGVPGNAPDPEVIQPDVRRYLEASRRAAADGKLLVAAAGNSPLPPVGDFVNGPPWFITVGGTEHEMRGSHAASSPMVDIVSNFSDIAPRWLDGELEWRSGTSFASPVVAATLANAIAAIRATGAEAPAGALREALNATGIYYGTTEWAPGPPGRDPLPFDLITYASLPVVSQIQMGWGYVNASFSDEIARRVVERDFSRVGKEQAEIFQPRWQAIREDHWS